MTQQRNDTSPDAIDAYASVPREMRKYRSWVCWRYEDDPERPDKPKKRPIDPRNLEYASHSDSLTWGTFEDAVKASEQPGIDGIGFVFSSGDPYAGIDLDGVVSYVGSDRTEVIDLWAKEVISVLSGLAYVEKSPSGTGYHLIFRGKLPRQSGKQSAPYGNGTVEAYSQNRFFTITGGGRSVLSQLFDAKEKIGKVWSLLGLNKAGDDVEGGSNVSYFGEVHPTGLNGRQVVEKARGAKNGKKFARLFDRGDTSGHTGHSEADMALVRLIAFWTGPDPEAIDRIFRESALMRGKWDEDHFSGTTYGEGTIGNVLRGMIAEGKGFYGQKPSEFASGRNGDPRAPLPEAPEYPLHALPEPIRGYVEVKAESLGVAPGMVATPLLMAAGSEIGRDAGIRIKQGYVESPALWGAVVGATGTTKSPAIEQGLAPIASLQAKAARDWEDERKAWLDAEKRWKQEKGKDKTPFDQRKPVLEHHLTTNTTLEALVASLATSPGITVYKDEIAGLVQSMDAYRGGKGGDRQNYLEAWSGNLIKVDRKGAEPLIVANPVVGIIGGIQPSVLSVFQPKPRQGEPQIIDGFVHRFLFEYPEHKIADWVDDDEEEEETLWFQVDALFAKLRHPTFEKPDERVIVTRSGEAKKVWSEWHRSRNVRLDASHNEMVRGFYSKAPRQLARLALILHCLGDPELRSREVSGQTMRGAVALVEYHLAMAWRVLAAMGKATDPQTLGLVGKVRSVLDAAKGSWVTRTELNHRLNRIPRKHEVDEALATLQEEGAVECRVEHSGKAGGRRIESWRRIVTVGGEK